MTREYKIDAEIITWKDGAHGNFKLNLSVLKWGDTNVVIAYLPCFGKRFAVLADIRDDAVTIVGQFVPLLADFLGVPPDDLAYTIPGSV